jgi:hypothetical protein
LELNVRCSGRWSSHMLDLKTLVEMQVASRRVRALTCRAAPAANAPDMEVG